MDRPDRPIRVLVFDAVEVFYDAWWGDFGWGMKGSRRSGTYYRESTARVQKMSRLRIDPLTPKERSIHRPDLPLRMYRHSTLNWGELACRGPDELVATAARHGADLADLPRLDSPSVALEWIPPTVSGRVHRIKATARDGQQLTASEVLWHAQQLFAARAIEVDPGIGLFRGGFHQGAPSFYLAGYHDLGGLTWHAEHGAIAPPTWSIRKQTVGGDYRKRLSATKGDYPFETWAEAFDEGLDQYTPENCAAIAAVFDRMIAQLIHLGEAAAEAAKLDAFRAAVEALNAMEAAEPGLIETGECEQLCELFNQIAAAAGLEPEKYGGGEGPASEWRDW